MATSKVEPGTLVQGAWEFAGGMGSAIMVRASTGETYDFSRDVEHVELLDEGKVLTLMNTAGFGIAAVALLGPLGAIDGLRAKGKNREIAFAAYLKDGKKFLATTDIRSWSAIRATLLP